MHTVKCDLIMVVNIEFEFFEQQQSLFTSAYGAYAELIHHLF